MALAYTEGRSLASNLLADLRTAILASSDWTRPNSGSRPDTYKCTTTRGADMVIDLADAAIDTTKMTVAFYTSYDGTTLGTKQTSTRYLTYKGSGSGSTATNWVYWTVSVSKEHIFIMIEGPKPSDANADSATYGSVRSYVFMNDLTPYFAVGTDPLPAVVVHASPDTGYKNVSNFSHKVWVNQTSDGATKWNSGYLCSLDFVSNTQGPFTPNRVGLDGNLFLAPYVYFDDTQGIRGRLTSLFFAGPNQNYGDWQNTPNPVNTFVTYSGIKYKLLAASRGNNLNGGSMGGPLGWFNNNTGQPQFLASPLVAVPYALAP